MIIDFRKINGGGGEGGSINNAGSETNPIYTKNGKAIACPTSTDGKRWGTVPRVRDTDGVMEVGKYLDFHETSDGTSDYDGRVLVKNNSLYFSDGQSEKRVLLNGDGGYTIVDNLPSNAQLRTLALDDEEGADNTSAPVEEGQMAWLKTEYEDVEATTIHMITDRMGWEHIGSFRRTDGVEIFPLGASRNEGEEASYFMVFGEGFIDDGSWRIKMFNIEGVDYIFHYSWVNGSRDFSYFWDNDDVVFEWQERIAEAGWFSTTEETLSHKVREGAQYIYSDEYGWMKNVYDLDSMNDEERLALAKEISDYLNIKELPFPFPVIFKHGDKSYRATNLYASYDGGDNTEVKAWSINGDTKSIILAMVHQDGAMHTEERSIVDPPVILDLNRMEDWERRNLIDSVRYYREELGQTFPEPIIFSYNDITYRASEISAGEGYLEATTVDPISRESVGAFIDENGNLEVSATGGVYYFSEEMSDEELLRIYNEIKNNMNDGIYAGSGVFYALDDSGRAVINTVRMIEGWEEGTEDWIQLFAWTYQDGSQYIISIGMHYVYETDEIRYEYSRNAI